MQAEQANQAHPDLNQLNAFVLGRLDPPDIDAVEAHLSSCDTCCDALKQMKEDTFVGLVRDAKPGADPQPRLPADALALQQAATLPTSETPPAPGPAGNTADIANADSDAATVAPTSGPADTGTIPAEMLDHPRYRIQELVGVGGMGAVYKAEHRLMQRTVALKVINPRFIQSKQAVERFRREVQAAARLQHPNIVHAYDAEQAGDVHFLVMEYVNGTDLNQVLQERGPLPVHLACEYIRQAALGLQHAHEMGMVHRDIKPQNLMVVSGGVVSGRTSSLPTTHHSPLTTHQVKILDFGLASLTSQSAPEEIEPQTAVDSQKSGLTQAGTLMGTPDYMAPEQARDARGADIRSDIYSLGCTLYTLLAGTVPFPGGTAVDKVIAHASNHAEPIEKVRDDVPGGVAQVLRKMMAKAPAERYQTPAEVAAALASFAEPRQPAPTRAGRRFSRGRIAALAAIAAGALMLLAGVILIRTNKGTLKIDCEVDDVQVVISQGGEQLEVIDVPTGSTVKRLPTGNYDIALRGDNLKVKLDRNGFTITRSGLAVVKVTLTDETREAKIEAATKAAERWLALMDAGEVEKAWDQSAALAHKTLTREAAIKSYQNLGRVVGKVKWRMVHQRDYAASWPGLPPGDYVKIDYASYFDALKETSESVFMTREKDGQWRPFLYATLAWLAGQPFPPPAATPFDAAVAKQYQEGWAKHLGADVEITNSLGMKLRLIPAGKLAMHPETSKRPDGSVNEVKEPFYAGVHEVTVGQFRQFVKETGYQTTAEKDRSGGLRVLGGSRGTSRDRAFVWRHPDFASDDNLPVAFITWHDAMAFCRWLSKKEGRAYRLPTEVESLWLLRAGSPDRYFFGDDAAELEKYSWHSKPGTPLDRPQPVGQKQPNPWGLYDVHGNVGELCYEWLSLGAKPRLEVAEDGPGPNNALVQRGGGYADEADAGTGGTGWFRTPMSHIGFRVVLVGNLKASTPTAVQAVQRFVGHNGKVIRVALSPDARLLASTGEDNTVRVWDAKTGKQLREFATKFTPVPVAISPDGELVAAIVCPGPFPDKVIVWQVKDGKKLFEFPMISGWTGCVAFSPDSRYVAWAEAFDHKASDDAIRIVEARTGKEVRVIRNTKDVITNWTLAYSPDGKELACAGKDGVLNVWDPASGKHLRQIKGHAQQITRVDYSPDGRYIITGSLDKTVKVWNAKTGELVRSVDGRGAGVTSTFSRDGRWLVSKAADHSVEVWDASTDEKIASLPGHLMGLMHVVVSSDGKFIASGSFDNTVRLWRMPAAAAQNVSAALQGHWKPVAVEQNGQPVPKEALNRIQFPMMFLFKGDRWGAVSPDGRRYESTFTLDADKKPAWVDVKGSLFEGMPDLHGILKVEKDSVVVCVVEKNQVRPTEFTTKGKRGYMLIVARRLSDTDAKIEFATQAAEAWLRLMDAGDHGQAWEQASQAIRNALTKKNFVALAERSDRKLGKLKSRIVLNREDKRIWPGAPPGDYVAIQYRSEYENWPKVAELVVPTLESDGVWRVSGWHNNPETIAPPERELALAVRAGRGKLSKDEQQELKDHPLAALLADPGKKAILEWFASLPDSAHQHLLKEGYLKWKVGSLDPAQQKALREGVKRGLDEMKKLGVRPPATQSLEALDKADVGFALVNVLGLKHSVVSWYLHFPASPQPGFSPVVGPKVDDPQAWAEAHLADLIALRAKAYSKSIAEFAKAQ